MDYSFSIIGALLGLAIGKKAGLSKSGVLLAMTGGGKAGNIISPNPNTIAASEAFGVDLTSLMLQNAVPAVFALVVAILLASMLAKNLEVPLARVTSMSSRTGPCLVSSQPSWGLW